jgi:hypothetical protein
MKTMIEHIPAHDRVTKLYTFYELDRNVQERLVMECGDRYYDAWNDEYRNTLKKLEELFNVKCDNWRVDQWTYNYDLHIGIYNRRLDDLADCYDDSDWGYLTLKGNRAMGKCWTMWERDVVKGKYYFKGKKNRQSKVLFDGLHDGTCPLTGVCMDNDALDPLWDMMEGTFIRTNTTIADMIDMCFDSFFRAWKNEMQYVYTEEYFRENEMAEFYDEYGEIIDVPKDAIIKDVA